MMDRRELFAELWSEFLLENEKAGSDIRATPRSIEFYLKLFDAYEAGHLRGVVVLEPYGVTMMGEIGTELDRLENAAESWGTYVRPEHREVGIARELRTEAYARLRNLGITWILGAHLVENRAAKALMAAEGWKPLARVYIREV